jgi:hypothetical protein
MQPAALHHDSTFDDIKAKQLERGFEDGAESSDYDTAPGPSPPSSPKACGGDSSSGIASGRSSSRRGKVFEDYIGLKSVDDKALYGIPAYHGRQLMWPHEYYREAVANQMLNKKDDDADETSFGKSPSSADFGTAAMRANKLKQQKSMGKKSGREPRGGGGGDTLDKKRAMVEGGRFFARDFSHLIQHLMRYVIGGVRDFMTEIQLSNKTEPPSRNTVGRCRLNQVDPCPITYSLSKP